MTLPPVLVESIRSFFQRQKYDFLKVRMMKLVTAQMVDDLIARAGETGRLRLNHNIHEFFADPVQRLFVAAGRGSYFRPHRHDAKSEFALVLRGRFDILLFDDEGTVTHRIAAGPDCDVFALEIPADCYHTWIPVAEASVFFEVKQGPYDPARSLSFAPWSPPEDSAAVGAFQARLAAARAGERVA
ncbi:MAG: WbuC family cupin fold metalloprotein [Syntrophaceae bacterium]|nr:WbuC family cupin fold metalloprotein [Syntrophaceae bacterium]